MQKYSTEETPPPSHHFHHCAVLLQSHSFIIIIIIIIIHHKLFILKLIRILNFFFFFFKFIRLTSSTAIYFSLINPTLNTLNILWPILGQRKSSLVVFLWKRRMSSVFFFNQYIYRPLEILLAELVLLFYKNITKLDFLWPNMGHKTFTVLIILLI